MIYDFSYLVNNTNTIIDLINEVLSCLWVSFSVMVCALVLILFRSVKK